MNNPSEIQIKTKREVAKLMKSHGIGGELTGSGTKWQVELPTDQDVILFDTYVGNYGGYTTGYGAVILRPGYESLGDWNYVGSRHHY